MQLTLNVCKMYIFQVGQSNITQLIIIIYNLLYATGPWYAVFLYSIQVYVINTKIENKSVVHTFVVFEYTKEL